MSVDSATTNGANTKAVLAAPRPVSMANHCNSLSPERSYMPTTRASKSISSEVGELSWTICSTPTPRYVASAVEIATSTGAAALAVDGHRPSINDATSSIPSTCAKKVRAFFQGINASSKVSVTDLAAMIGRSRIVPNSRVRVLATFSVNSWCAACEIESSRARIETFKSSWRCPSRFCDSADCPSASR